MKSLSTLASAFEPPTLTADQWAEIDRKAAEMERAEIESRRRQRIDRSGIPMAYRGATLRGVRVEVAEWAADPKGALMLRGPVGCGKTWAACAALSEAAGSITVKFATLRQVSDDVRASQWGENPLASYCRTGALCLDDLGKEQMTPAKLSLLFELVKARDESGRPTIYTTNYSWAALTGRLTAGDDPTLTATIMSRLSRCRIVDIPGRDRRLNG